jgi:hypothetical protein
VIDLRVEEDCVVDSRVEEDWKGDRIYIHAFKKRRRMSNMPLEYLATHNRITGLNCGRFKWTHKHGLVLKQDFEDAQASLTIRYDWPSTSPWFTRWDIFGTEQLFESNAMETSVCMTQIVILISIEIHVHPTTHKWKMPESRRHHTTIPTPTTHHQPRQYMIDSNHA